MKTVWLVVPALLICGSASAAPLVGAEYFATLQAADRAYGERRYPAAESLYAHLAENSQDVWVWYRLGQSRVQQKRYLIAADAFRHALPLGTQRARESYLEFMRVRIARCHALAGERDSAIAWLEQAIANGYEDRGDLAEDDDLASLRGDPRFERLAGRLGDSLTRDEGWRYDLDYLVSEIRRVHVRFRNEPLPRGFESEVHALRAEIPRLDDAHVMLRLQGLMARLGDGHTVLYPFGRRVTLPSIPIRMYHFEDGWFVVEAPDSLNRWIGRRALAMGGVPIDTLARRVASFISLDNTIGIEWIGPLYLQLGDLIAAIGGARDAHRIQLTLQDRAGHREEVTVVADKPLRPQAPKLGPPPGGSPPLWLRDVQNPYWVAPLPAPGSLYVQFNQVADADSETLGAFALRLRAMLNRDATRNLVVDLRHNNGGNGYLLGELRRTLVWFVADDPRNRLFLLTGRGTFSAAQIFLNQIDQETSAIVAGEPSSSRPDFPGEDTSLLLPWSGVHGSISSRWHMVDGADTRTWIAPRIPVRLTSADYFGNRDPVLDAVLAVIGQGK
jgi:tetratricopeptide (TPR) repeat protein